MLSQFYFPLKKRKTIKKKGDIFGLLREGGKEGPEMNISGDLIDFLNHVDIPQTPKKQPDITLDKVHTSVIADLRHLLVLLQGDTRAVQGHIRKQLAEINKALDGEGIIIAKGKTSLIQLMPLPECRPTRRLGGAEGLSTHMSDDFDAPLFTWAHCLLQDLRG